jgi:hypothetical protein
LEGAQYDLFERTARGLPLLDSFIKESARLTPVESCESFNRRDLLEEIYRRTMTNHPAVSTRRQALKPFSFSNGTKLAVGDWACTPVQALMQTGAHYPQPLDFNGFRFVDPGLFSEEDMSANKVFQPAATNFTDVGNTYHVWGTGRMTW